MIRVHQFFKIHMKTMISALKSLILTTFVKKKHLSASPLPGVTLGGEHPPAARCAEVKMCQKTPNFEKHFSVLDRSSPTLPETHP